MIINEKEDKVQRMAIDRMVYKTEMLKVVFGCFHFETVSVISVNGCVWMLPF